MSHLLQTIRFEFERMKLLAEKGMVQCSDTEFDYRISEHENSIRIVVQHMAGNLLSRWTDFLTSDGEKDWRNRDAEFENQTVSRTELMQQWEMGWAQLFKAIDALTESHLMQEVSIRKEPLTVTQALFRQLGHYSYHVGQIVLLAKARKGELWNSLSIPKGKSTDFVNKGTYLRPNK
jgi:Protein of unknown function (DUF1572)